jgi:hypothetical protein
MTWRGAGGEAFVLHLHLPLYLRFFLSQPFFSPFVPLSIPSPSFLLVFVWPIGLFSFGGTIFGTSFAVCQTPFCHLDIFLLLLGPLSLGEVPSSE